MRSFSTLWYWIALLGFWYAAGARVLGIPYEMVISAKHNPVAAEELETMARIYVPRHLQLGQTTGVWLTAVGSLALTVLYLLGFSYGLELAQAVFFFALPLCILTFMRYRAARRIALEAPAPDMLRRRLIRHRFRVQLLAMLSIFATVLWGMWHSLTVGVLGN